MYQIDKLDLKKVSASFGLDQVPRVNLSIGGTKPKSKKVIRLISFNRSYLLYRNNSDNSLYQQQV